MSSRKSIFMLAALAVASFNAAACYTVVDRSNRVLFQGEDSPVDMSRAVKPQIDARFPGGHLMFDLGRCEAVPVAMLARPAGVPAAPNTAVMGAGPANGKVVATASTSRRAPSSPLLTDRRTAESMNLPYTVLQGNVVVVGATAASRVDLPTFNVVPSPVAATGAATVITEMHNPPMTVVQRGDEVTVTRR
ncbi:MAG: hypothetical protein HY854_07675 [Burkholderiales bacterium]|nr:hypothetical protein [Burkholderiales bacterium]